MFTGLFKNKYLVSIIYVLSPALSAGVPCASTKPPDLGHRQVFWEESTAGVGEKGVSTTSLLSFKEGCTRWLETRGAHPWPTQACPTSPLYEHPQSDSPKTRWASWAAWKCKLYWSTCIINIIPSSLFSFLNYIFIEACAHLSKHYNK